jgi:uncharacterized protein YqgV (UPF0045/DUF77 family)
MPRMANKKVYTYRERIEQNTEEIEGYNYIDVDYVTDILDEIEDKVDKMADIENVGVCVDAAVDNIVSILKAINEYVANKEVPSKLGELFEEIAEYTAGPNSIKGNLESILNTLKTVNPALNDLTDDLF